jgi:hypothetical protein
MVGHRRGLADAQSKCVSQVDNGRSRTRPRTVDDPRNDHLSEQCRIPHVQEIVVSFQGHTDQQCFEKVNVPIASVCRFGKFLSGSEAWKEEQEGSSLVIHQAFIVVINLGGLKAFVSECSLLRLSDVPCDYVASILHGKNIAPACFGEAFLFLRDGLPEALVKYAVSVRFSGDWKSAILISP